MESVQMDDQNLRWIVHRHAPDCSILFLALLTLDTINNLIIEIEFYEICKVEDPLTSWEMQG